MRGVSAACAVICSASAVGLVLGCRSSVWTWNDDMGIPFPSNRGCMHGATDTDLMARQGRHAPPCPYRNKVGRGHLNLMDAAVHIRS